MIRLENITKIYNEKVDDTKAIYKLQEKYGLTFIFSSVLAVFPFSLLSLSQIARVFAFRQWIAMDLILFTAVLVIMQLIRGKHEGGMFLRNKTARIICMAAFLVVFLPLAYITIPTVFILGKPAFMSMDAWVFMFGKQGGANQYILHLWWAASAVLLDMGIAK